jgi:hypothetical protein
LLASDIAISVLTVNATAFKGVRVEPYLVGPAVVGVVEPLRRTQAFRQVCERSSPNPGDSPRWQHLRWRIPATWREEKTTEVFWLAAARAASITEIK